MKEAYDSELFKKALSKNELQSFNELHNSTAFELSTGALAVTEALCGVQALEDGDTRYWKGYRDGLRFFHELVGSRSRDYRLMIANEAYEELRRERASVHFDPDEEDKVDLTQAISDLGSSSL